MLCSVAGSQQPTDWERNPSRLYKAARLFLEAVQRLEGIMGFCIKVLIWFHAAGLVGWVIGKGLVIGFGG